MNRRHFFFLAAIFVTLLDCAPGITPAQIGAIDGGRRRAAAGGPVEIAHVETAGTPGGVTSVAINSTGADFIVVVVSGFSGTITLTDSKSNGATQTALTQRTTGVVERMFFYDHPASVGTGHTFTSGGVSFASICVIAFSGMAASPLDQQAGATGNTVSTLATGSITPSQANTLVVTGLANENNSSGAISVSSPSGFSTAYKTLYSSGVAEGSAISYKVLTSATATNPTWNVTNSTSSLAATVASFKY